MMSTYQAKKGEITRDWKLIDLKGRVLGRVASEIAVILRGKNKPHYTPHVDCGDFVVAINASKLVLTGNKLKDKMYHYHTGYPGGLKTISAGKLLEKNAARMLQLAVRGMLPRGVLGRSMLKKIKIYNDGSHPHGAQKPG